MARVLLVADERFLDHDVGAGHPERPERLGAVLDGVVDAHLDGDLVAAAPRRATVEELTAVHQPAQVQLIETLCATGGGHLDGDTAVVPASCEAAFLAAGAGLLAVERLQAGDADAAFLAVRPPGHHATPRHAMGFCLFNNVAVAAAHARAAHGLNRVLIVDWDVHHGNGTQDIFYSDGDVYFLSLHRFPFYPGTGAAQETGAGAGLGATLNIPLRFGVTRRDYRDAFARSLEEIAVRCRPELVLISAGFDAHALDPVGSLGLESEDFADLTRLVIDAARQFAQGRIVSLLEGGYHLQALPESVGCHLTTLLEEPA